MKLFGGTTSQSFLGVDIGASSIKIVELGKEKKRPKLMTYGYSELETSLEGVHPFDDVKGTAKLITEICKKAGTKSTMAMAALPASGVFSTILTLPYTKDKKLMQSKIDAEVAKLAPLPIEQMITYSTFLDEVSKDKKSEKKDQKSTDKKPQKKHEHTRVLVTGSAKTLVQKYVEIFKLAKLELQAIDTEAFALTRALIGKDRSATLVIDMGSKRTNLMIAERGVPFLSRSMNIGGDSITERLQGQMNMSISEAERLKRDLGSSHMGEVGKVPAVLEPFMQSIVNEIRYAFQLYANMEVSEKKAVEKIVLTGGSAQLPGVLDYLSSALNLNVYRGDPWARVMYPEELRPMLDEIGSRMSVGIGLAMREME